MIEERTPPGESHGPTQSPEYSQVGEFQESSSAGPKIAIVVFVLIAGIAAGYGWLQHNAAQQLESERADLRASLAQAKSQEDALAAKVNALSAAQAQAQEEAARAPAETVKNEQFLPRTSEVPRHTIHQAAARRVPVDDPRWKQVQQQLGDQQKELADSQKQIADSQKQIADTQANLDKTKSDLEGNLQSARTELGGDIARNHGELVALEKKGERTYYEFSFEKSKTYHHTGPISIALRKADAKHEYCDLVMVVDDKEITRKHINLYESITLHPQGYTQPLELVINRIDVDSVHGYVSEAKYRSTEQAAGSVTQQPTSASVNPPAPAGAEVKLEHRDEAVH
ncbi:MAG: hypothetical protein ABSG32_10350 [Terriglobia bacterium]